MTVIMVPSAAAAAQLGTALPPSPGLAALTVDTILTPQRQGETSAMVSSEGDAAGNEATWSHLQEALLSANVANVSPLACEPSSIIMKKMMFNTNLRGKINLETSAWCPGSGWNISHLMTSPPQRWGGKDRDDSCLCALRLSSSGRQSYQWVVNPWLWGRLFVWILFKLTSQASVLSLVVDVLLNCGRCLGKMLWPGQKGVNHEVTVTVRGCHRLETRSGILFFLFSPI